MKKFLSLLLCLSMVLCMMPTAAFAADEDGSTDEGAEVRYSTDGGVNWTEDSLINVIYDCYEEDNIQIELLRDIILDGTANSGNWSEGQILAFPNQHITIDGKGHKITRGAELRKVASINQSDSVVTLKDIIVDGGAVWSSDDPATRTNSGLSFEGNAHLFTVDDGGTLILESGTVLQNSHITSDALYGAAISVGTTGSGTLVMKNGAEIKDNTVYCGAVYVWDGGKFTMEGGTISGNYGMNNGGAVCMGGGTFEMKGGTITGNKASAGGGAVSVFASTATFTMSGGSITNNAIAGSLGGGVLVYGGDITVSGSPVIKDNTSKDSAANNVYLTQNKKITVGGTGVKDGAYIGLTVAVPPAAGSAIEVNGDHGNCAQYFSSDDEKYSIKADDQGNVQLVNERPGAPVDLSTQVNVHEVTLTWSKPSFTGDGGIISYEVSKDGGQTWTNVGNVNTYTFTDLPYQEYNFCVRAVNSAGGGEAAKANCTPNPGTFTVRAESNLSEGGTIEGAGSYTEPASATLTAIPAEGYRFVKWTEDGKDVSTDASYTFTVSKDTTLIAVFEKIPSPTIPSVTYYQVDCPQLDHGTVTLSKSYVPYGGSVTLTIAPEEGYQVKDVLINGKSVGAVETYIIDSVKENIKVSVVFEEKSAAPANDRIIKGVEDTEIWITKTSRGKGWIKLWYKKSFGYKVDYYEVFRSKNSTKNFGKTAFYQTKNNKITGWYKNTKSVKKGNRYYYKVRGVRVIDGKKYYTKWSKAVYRTAK